MVIVVLLPVARPGHQHGVVLQAPEATGLEQVGGGVAEVGGDGHLTEALHLLRLHQFTQRLHTNLREEFFKFFKGHVKRQVKIKIV